jgi:hypothetical protein
MTVHHETDANSTGEIEITEEMIEAASGLLLAEEIPPYDDVKERLVKIYRAMEMARPGTLED